MTLGKRKHCLGSNLIFRTYSNVDLKKIFRIYDDHGCHVLNCINYTSSIPFTDKKKNAMGKRRAPQEHQEEQPRGRGG